MPIPFAPLVGWILGVVFAWNAAPELGRDDGPLVASRPFMVAVAFVALVYTPIITYFAVFHGDWAYVYAVASRRVPSALDFAFVLLGGASVLLGFVTAVPLVKKRKTSVVVTSVVVPGAVALALLAITARRLVVSATFAQFQGDFGGEPLAESALGRGVLWMGIVLALGVAWCIRAMWAMNAEANESLAIPRLRMPSIRR